MKPITLSTSSIVGTNVYNRSKENLGNIEDLMIDLNDGSITYVVLSFGGFLGLGDKYFAIPWALFSIDTKDEKFILNVDKKRLENAPGFDKDNWPVDINYIDSVYTHYGYKPYSSRFANETSMKTL